MKCRYCGEQLEKGIDVCKVCGRKNKSKHDKKIIITAAMGIVAVIVALSAIFILSNKAGGEEEKINETVKEAGQTVIEPWNHFTEHHDIMRASYETVEIKYGELYMHENDMSVWGDFTYLGLIADVGTYYYTDEDMLFIFEGTGLYCMGIAGTAEQLFGITEPVDMAEMEEMILLEDSLALEWATDVRDKNWYGIKTLEQDLVRISFYNEGLQRATPNPGYDPLQEGSKYPSKVTLDNIGTVHSDLGDDYRTVYPSTHVSICIEKF